MARTVISQHIVADSEICHGKPTVVGTRIMVWEILEMIADGMDWDSIVDAWDGRVPREAIAETVDFANQVFMAHAIEYTENHSSAA